MEVEMRAIRAVGGVMLILSAATSSIPAQVTTLHTFNGSASSDLFGFSVAGAGDVNHDGHADVIVGAIFASPPARMAAGQATVFSGKDGSVLYKLNGLAPGDAFGWSTAGAGDVNKDGYADLIVGAYLADPLVRLSAGRARVFSGKDGSVLHTFNGLASADMFGWSVAGAGDVNRDGHADLIVGACGAGNYTGQTRVFSGKDGSVLYTFNGLAAGDGFGRAVAGAGDVNKDGHDDFIVGASGAGASRAGQATVFSGRDGSVLQTFNGLVNGDGFGVSTAGAGDVDKDGFPDLIVGAAYASPGGRRLAGQAMVFSGRDGRVLYTFNGLAAGDYFGASAAGGGDVDLDGFADLVIGAFAADPGGRMDAGQATVFSGQDGRVLYTFDGLAAGDGFGRSVAGAGDVNRDIFPDLVIGAFAADPAGRIDAGQATVLSMAKSVIYGSGTPRIGVTITLHLLAPGDRNHPYQLGSSLGTGPILIGNRKVGLSPDDLLAVSVIGLWPAIFSGYRGVIDSRGQAQAAIHIPTTAALIGVRLHSAFVTSSSAAPSGITSASNTFSFTIGK